MTLKLKKYKLALFIGILGCIIFPSLVFSYTNIAITGIKTDNPGTGKLTIEWETNLNTEGNVIYGTNKDAYSNSVYERKAPSTKHKIEINDMEVGKIYYFQIVASNAVKVTRSKVFEDMIGRGTERLARIKDVEISNFAKTVSGEHINVSFETNIPSNATLTLKKNNLTIENVALGVDTNHGATFVDLTPSTCYDLNVFLEGVRDNFYTNKYSICTLTKSVLPASSAYKSSNIEYYNNWQYPSTVINEGGVIVAGIEYELFPALQAVYKTANSPKIWLIANNQRHLITSPRAFDSYGFIWSDVEVVSWPEIARYNLAKLVKSPNNNTVYFLHEKADGTLSKIVIPSSTVFDSYPANKRENIVTVSQYDIDSYENVSLVRAINTGYLYYVSGNVKHYIAQEVAYKYNYNYDDVLAVNSIHLSRYIDGDGLK